MKAETRKKVLAWGMVLIMVVVIATVAVGAMTS